MRKWVLTVAGLAVVAVGLWWSLHRSHRVGAAKPVDRVAAPRIRGAIPPQASQAVPDVLVDDDPRGELRLEGIVLDASERPVGGVTVTVSSNPPREAITEADGGFAFDALVGRAYTLVARGNAGIAGPVTVRLTAKSDPVMLHLRAAAKVTVAATTSDGKPVDGATVELRGADTQRETTKAGVAELASVVPGRYQLAAWADGTARTLVWLAVGAGETHARVVLVAGAPVSGKVVDDRGAAVAGARVAFQGASDWTQQADPRRDGVASGADGTFRFAALPAGSFRFTASDASHAPGTSELVTLDGRHERGDVIIRLGASATVRGRVVDAQHQPVAGARVRVGVAARRGAGGMFEPPHQAYSGQDGTFVLHGLPRRELEAVALHEAGASQIVAVDASAGDPPELELVLDLTGTIAGTVVDPEGNPIEGAQVAATPDFGQGGPGGGRAAFRGLRLRGLPEDLTDAGGRFTLTGLAPGSYRVTASRERAAGRGRRGGAEGVVAEPGANDVKIVLQPEGGVKGQVQFADGSAPTTFTVAIGGTSQSFTGSPAFELDALAPGPYHLQVRGPEFSARGVDVTIEPAKTADVGTLTVERGRTLSGTVVANGQPVAGATVYAGAQLRGNGSSTTEGFGPLSAGTKSTTTGEDGTFSLAGFGGGDLTLVAEHPDYGRSAALRVPQALPDQTQLVLELQPPGALSGTLRQGGQPVGGVAVTCQSTTTPGAIYAVASGPDGRYRYDRLAPDTYKVSAAVGRPFTGMKFYSKDVVVPSGQEVTADLAVDPGAVTLTVTAAASNGTLGLASVWLATGAIAAHTDQDLLLALAAAGPGGSQWVTIHGEPATFSEVAPGAYTACVVPFPAQVHGRAAIDYAQHHADQLPAFCQAVNVAASPSTQSATVAVQIPPYIPDPPPGGSGSPASSP